MNQIKSRNWTVQEDQDLISILEEKKQNHIESTWNEIAIKLREKNLESRKTGKQCRERWANQLDPKIKRSENWTEEENKILFGLHFELGNKWAEICSQIPGRTDNCVKNHFYSTMRRGIRKINSYIENVKRKTSLSKTFKNEILNKVLTLCEGRNNEKLQFTDKAKSLALKIKADLIELSLSFTNVDEENQSFKEQIFSEISEFCRNCRKRKTKKFLEPLSEKEDGLEQNFIKTFPPSSKQLSENENVKNEKSERKYEKPLQVPELEIVSNSAMVNENKLALLKIVKPILISENLSNLKSEDKIKKNFDPECRENSNREGHEDALSLFCSWQSFSSLFCRKKPEKKKEEPQEKQEKGFMNFIPEAKKNERNLSRKSNGCFDFSTFEIIQSIQKENNLENTANTFFPSIIKSQELEIPEAMKMKFQNKKNSEDKDNGVFSFFSSSSPFSLCTPPLNFESLTSILTKEEKFTSTKYDSLDFEEFQNLRECNEIKENQVTSTFFCKSDRDEMIEE